MSKNLIGFKFNKCKIKKNRNFLLKSKVKFYIKKINYLIKHLNFNKIIYYYKLFIKLIDSFTIKKIFKKNKINKIKKKILFKIKNLNFG